jgi:hypothetical protein
MRNQDRRGGALGCLREKVSLAVPLGYPQHGRSDDSVRIDEDPGGQRSIP